MSDPRRLHEDAEVADLLRQDLGHAVSADVQGLDVQAGLVRLEQGITHTAPATGSTGLGASGKLVVILLVAAGAAGLWTAVENEAPTELQGRIASGVPEPRPDTVAVPEALQMHEPQDQESTPDAPEEGSSDGASPASPKAANGPTHGIRPSPRQKRPEQRPAVTTSDEDGSASFLWEAKQVARARRALDEDPETVLEVLERIDERVPEGQLLEERRALEVLALVASGREGEGRRRAQVFLQEHGQSPHAAAVRRATAHRP